MIWVILAILVAGYFIYEAIQQNTKTKALDIINSPSYIKKETEGKRLYCKRIFDIAERDLKTRDSITQQGVKLFTIDPRKSPSSSKLSIMSQIDNYQKAYKRVMKEKQEVYTNSIRALDKDPFFLKFDFMKNDEDVYNENFFDLDGNQDLRKRYDYLHKYADEITDRYNKLQDKIKID